MNSHTTMLLQCVLVLLALSCAPATKAFAPAVQKNYHRELFAIDPSMLAIAFASASAGAATQVPLIRGLRREIEDAKIALSKVRKH